MAYKKPFVVSKQGFYKPVDKDISDTKILMRGYFDAQFSTKYSSKGFGVNSMSHLNAPHNGGTNLNTSSAEKPRISEPDQPVMNEDSPPKGDSDS
jgi:hypothetical protein